MKLHLISSFLVGGVSAAVIDESIKFQPNTSLVAPAALQLCEDTAGCEIFESPEGKLGVSFAKRENRQKRKRTIWSMLGLEKREDGNSYNIAMGKDRINYGWVTPSDALNAIKDQGICTDAMCLGTAYVRTEIVGGPCANEEYLEISAIGDYPPGSLDNWMDAIKAAFNEEVDTEYVDWSGSGDPNTNLCGSGTNEEKWQSNSIGINRYVNIENNDVLQGTMKIQISKSGSDACDRVLAALGAVTGTISAIGGGFFGVLGSTPLCGELIK